MAMWSQRFAPAKVNLFLHVGPVAADGYHPVCSLMAFADVGDTVRLRDSPSMSFRLEGPFSGALETDPDNLVVRARDRMLATAVGPVAPFELVLEKALPIAAGLGGGSADAAAALVLVESRLVGPGEPLRESAALARTLGADVTACLHGRAIMGLGRGDDLSPAPRMPALCAVLANPMAPSPTGAVYRAFDSLPPGAGADLPELPAEFVSVEDTIAFLRTTRNDLEAPAVSLQPVIGDLLGVLRGHSEALLTRMSGSGATCFALCADQEASARLASRLSASHPHWWIRACRLS